MSRGESFFSLGAVMWRAIMWNLRSRRALGAAICEISTNAETTNYLDAGNKPAWSFVLLHFPVFR